MTATGNDAPGPPRRNCAAQLTARPTMMDANCKRFAQAIRSERVGGSCVAREREDTGIPGCQAVKIGIHPQTNNVRAVLLPAMLLALLLVPAAAGRADPAPPPARDPRFGIAAASLNPPAMLRLAAGSDRVVLPWQALQPNGPDDWNTTYFPDALLQQELRAGVDVVGLLQDTPAWARRDPAAGPASVPSGL